MGFLARWSSLYRPNRRRYRPLLEILEDRCLPSIITVVNNSDSGSGSLRAAVTSAAAGDTINFSSSGLTDTAGTGQAQTIALTSGSLSPSVNVTITDAGAPAVSIVDTTSRVFSFTSGSLTAVTLQDLTINGTASDGNTGGAIRSSTSSGGFTLTVDTCNISGALLVATRGGAISFTGGNDSLIVTNSIVMGTVTAVNTVSNNDAGAIYAATNRSVSITDSTISGSVTGSSSGANYGGAVYQNSGTLNLTNCTISGSSVTGAKGNGGAFDIQGGTANLSGCTITGNTASNNGGGVYVGRGTLNATNCTITGNTATNKGGGVAAFFYSSNSQNGTAVTNLTNCTISGNTATSGGGLYVGYHPHSTTTSTNTVTVNNTIVAGGLVRQTGGVITDTKEKLNVSNSLFDTTPTTGAGNTINGTNANNLFGTNPMLGSLASNGGTTQTLALLSGSAAIDAGSNTLASSLTTDQRGFHRFVNGVVDIGAYEYQPAAALALSSSDSPSTSGQSVTFTATLSVVTGSNTPTGSVTFSIDGVAAGTVALNGLSATFLTSSLSVGSHTVTASFNNATPFPPSTSSSLTQLVNAAPATGNPSYAVSADAGAGPQVNVYNAATGALVNSFDAFAASFTGGVRVAIGDVNGDGQDDIICAAGPGGGPQVSVFDGRTFQLITSFNAFAAGFTGGVFVAVGDVNGDGVADIICGAGAGAGPQVAVFSGKDGSLLASFYAFDASFTGGVRVAAGDINSAGEDDIICAAGPGGGPQVTVFDGKGLKVLASFYAFAASFTGGVFVAIGDVNGDGQSDIIAGAGAGGGPQVTVYDGHTQMLLDSFYALAPGFTGGVRVGFSASAEGPSAILTGAGPGGGPQVNSFDSSSLAVLSSFFALEPQFTGGVFVGG